MKKFFKYLSLVLVLLLAAFLCVDSFIAQPLVNYALKRGTQADPLSPPAAFEDVYPYPNKYEAM